MCFVHKPMQNADFGQILCRRASTKRHVTSRPTVRFSQTWYQKMRKTWKKKVMKRRVARQSRISCRGGGHIDPPPPPPPPVKIGLTRSIQDSETSIDFVLGPPGSLRERVNVIIIRFLSGFHSKGRWSHASLVDFAEDYSHYSNLHSNPDPWSHCALNLWLWYVIIGHLSILYRNILYLSGE